MSTEATSTELLFAPLLKFQQVSYGEGLLINSPSMMEKMIQLYALYQTEFLSLFFLQVLLLLFS